MNGEGREKVAAGGTHCAAEDGQGLGFFGSAETVGNVWFWWPLSRLTVRSP